MNEQKVSSNGDAVRFREFDDHRRQSVGDHAEMKRQIKDNERRVNDLERKWDRYVGPIVIFSSALTVVLVLTNLAVIVGVI